MPRHKPVERNGLFMTVMLDEQIQPGTFEFALSHVANHELVLSDLDARFGNDEVRASAYVPRVILKVVLLGCSHGLISSRRMAHAFKRNVVFMFFNSVLQSPPVKPSPKILSFPNSPRGLECSRRFRVSCEQLLKRARAHTPSVVFERTYFDRSLQAVDSVLAFRNLSRRAASFKR